MHNQILQRLIKNKFQAFIVGGAVRDILLGVKPKDYDIATNATPEQIISIFKDRNVKEVGKSFGVVIVDGIEVATFRKDRYFGLNAHNCEITYAETIEEDLSRRDFTINAMAMDIHGNIIDPFDARLDLEQLCIRFVGDPFERINEDPNRILRACRFSAKLKGRLGFITRSVLRECNLYVEKYVAPERIRLELLKAMEIQEASWFFQELNSLGIYLFTDMESCVKNNYHGKHHREGIFEHLMIVGDSISPKYPLLKLTGYLHDIGKPKAYQDNGDGTFVGHEKVGCDMVEQDLTRLKFSNDEVKYVKNLVKYHMRHHVSEFDDSSKMVRRTLSKFKEHDVNYKDFLRLKIADRKGNLAKEKFTLTEIKNMLKCFRDEVNAKVPFGVKDLAINGNDLIELGLEPGPIFSKLLNFCLNVVLEYPERNTKEELIPMVKGLLFAGITQQKDWNIY